MARKKKTNKLMKAVKNTIGVGVSTMVGSSVVGGISASVPGSAGAKNTINSSFQLLNIGQLAKNAKTITKQFK